MPNNFLNRSGAARPAVPDHVAVELVRDFNFYEDLEPGDIYRNLLRLYEWPDIFYTQTLGGHWVATRFDDVDEILRTPRAFASDNLVLPRIESGFKLLPVESNVPLHRDYRAIIQPFFTPEMTRRLEDRARDRTIELIGELRPQGRCEFVRDFAQRMPTAIFMSMVDLPDRDAEHLAPLEAARLPTRKCSAWPRCS